MPNRNFVEVGGLSRLLLLLAELGGALSAVWKQCNGWVVNSCMIQIRMFSVYSHIVT